MGYGSGISLSRLLFELAESSKSKTRVKKGERVTNIALNTKRSFQVQMTKVDFAGL